MNHDPMTVDHLDRSRTLDILCNRFYWPGVRRHVEEYVKNCHVCQRTIQASRSKVLTEIRETDHAPRHGNLNSKLRTTHNLEDENGRESHAASKRNDPVKW